MNGLLQMGLNVFNCDLQLWAVTHWQVLCLDPLLSNLLQHSTAPLVAASCGEHQIKVFLFLKEYEFKLITVNHKNSNVAI